MAGEHGRLVVAAPNGPAADEGIAPGMTLADARALAPDLLTAEADPRGDARALDRLAAWCARWSPCCAVDGSGPQALSGLWIDVTGCAHLFGGEQALAADVVRRMAEAGYAAHAAIADTPGAAWAWARYRPGDATPVLPSEETRPALAALPVSALRLPAPTAEALGAVGLRRIGDLLPIAREELAERFGMDLLRRLDHALDREAEPLAPRRPTPAYSARLVFPEPIARPEDIRAALDRLLATLCRRLGADGLGARRLAFSLYRPDRTVATAAVAASRPRRDPAHLMRLFEPRLETLDAGMGADVVVLEATAAERIETAQPALDEARTARAARRAAGPAQDLDALVDRLGSRLGAERVQRPALRDSHVPERAAAAPPASSRPVPGPATPAAAGPRPVHLRARAEPVEAIAALPDHPPARFRAADGVHRVARADGPERIEGEWWRSGNPGAYRDYYRVEDEDGHRFWLYREGAHGAAPGGWYLHGEFA